MSSLKETEFMDGDAFFSGAVRAKADVNHGDFERTFGARMLLNPELQHDDIVEAVSRMFARALAEDMARAMMEWEDRVISGEE